MSSSGIQVASDVAEGKGRKRYPGITRASAVVVGEERGDFVTRPEDREGIVNLLGYGVRVPGFRWVGAVGGVYAAVGPPVIWFQVANWVVICSRYSAA